ncbi:acyl-CoA thioesterase [Pontivivens insulae]|uniref:Thioeseterase n=1 Tax=Pontivivens insulae TaxID=1639689 RepID=A0A2R8AAH7_9RHOB|nr:acyl-CoA thioesterase [Pontivivens insulae]RED13003.1 acyl-CoA thioesterase FadM [Pontivivens insulae]SPF29095.1 hypothetical protein POI8812_01401 [Pontivivens insulae]
MYPFGRLIWQMFLARNQSKLGMGEAHISHHYCMPWDIDMFGEMNNGRVLTFTDLGRFPLALRGGLIGVIWRKKWALTMAGATVRWQRRILPFQRYTMRSRAVGHDGRFIYLHHTIWRKGVCHASVLYRSCARDGAKRVPIEEFFAALGEPVEQPPLPEWVEHWRQSEDARIWPPEPPHKKPN